MKLHYHVLWVVLAFAGCATTGSGKISKPNYYDQPDIDTLSTTNVDNKIYKEKLEEFKYKLSLHYNYSTDYYLLYAKADSLEKAIEDNHYKVIGKGLRKGLKTGIVLGTISSFVIYKLDHSIDNKPQLFAGCFGISIMASCGVGYLISAGIVAKRQFFGKYTIEPCEVEALNGIINKYKNNLLLKIHR